MAASESFLLHERMLPQSRDGTDSLGERFAKLGA